MGRKYTENSYGGRGNHYNITNNYDNSRGGDTYIVFDWLATLAIAVFAGAVWLIWQGIKHAVYFVESVAITTQQEVVKVSNTFTEYWPYFMGIGILATTILILIWRLIRKFGIDLAITNFFKHENDIDW